MNNPVANLTLVAARGGQRRIAETISIGSRCRLAEGATMDRARQLCADQDLVIGGYRLARDRADIIPADLERKPDRLFVWNTDADQAALREVLCVAAAEAKPLTSPPRLLLTAARLIGPELVSTGTEHCLVLTADFELEWQPQTNSARLAAVELVQSTRSIRFEDSSERSLLDTDEMDGPVRYAQGRDDAPLKPVATAQTTGTQTRHHYQVELTQRIPEQLHGKAVAEVTVLEKYTSYFLHSEAPEDADNHIWVPLLIPVMWGWSIRVGRRTDGEWGIVRRKLFMPTSQDSGLELPVWRTDSRSGESSAEGVS